MDLIEIFAAERNIILIYSNQTHQSSISKTLLQNKILC